MASIHYLLGAVLGKPNITPELAALLSALANGAEDRDLNLDDVSVNNITGPRFKITPEGGYAVQLLNGTGAPTVKGSLVSASTTTDSAFILQTNEYDSIGVCYETGIAAGELAWVVVAGLVDVLMVDSHATVNGEILIASATDGRGTTITNPGSGLPAVDIHFKECGHCLQANNAGTNVLARCLIHFN